MIILYKYRPLTDFLFKELYYQELYFASYLELNDPLDLSARIEFTPKEINQIENLLWFLFKTTLKIHEGQLTDDEKLNNQKLIEFNKNDELRNAYKVFLFDRLAQLAKEQGFISIDELENLLLSTNENIPFQLDISNFKIELKRLTKKFLENSHATCFSESNNDFLMWSHYASKHSGICLEFTLENNGLFPYKMTIGKRNHNKEEYLQRISKWKIEETIIWERIRKVKYQDKQPHINFFDFSPVFNNEYDCDLVGLSKSWTHKFANELEAVFSTKTLPWAYENEWRAIEINFGEKKEPEERINHYPIQCLTGIYFGIRTPEEVKKRIYKIFDKLQTHNIKYFNCVPTSGRELKFENWDYYQE
ncbi:MAG: DUF2971 domain-containing protein [Bacteroidetes bacterium]|nr:DUF2971 domain-containing protein [Bacteroidota bacterium]